MVTLQLAAPRGLTPGDAEVVAVGVGDAEVAPAPGAVGRLGGEGDAGRVDGGEGDVEVLDLEHDLDPRAADRGQALLGEARAGAGWRELGDRAEADHGVAPAQARVVVLAALDGEAERRVERDRGVEVVDVEGELDTGHGFSW